MKKYLKKAAQITCASMIALTMITGALPETASVAKPITAAAASYTPDKVNIETEYNASSDAIRIHWEKEENATGYRVYRYTDGKWKTIKTIQNNNTFEYRDSGLASAKTYSYKVKAYRKVNGTNYWGVSSDTKKAVTTPAQPALAVQLTTTDTVTLSWAGVTCSGYQLQQYVNGAWENVADIDKTNTSYTVTGLNPGTSYQYRLRAYKSDTVNGIRKYKASASKTATTSAVSNTASSSTDVFGEKLIRSGAKYLGKSYYSMDCSLFVQTVLNDLGYKFDGFGQKGAKVNANGIPRATYDWLKCKDPKNPPRISVDGGSSWIPLQVSKCSRKDNKYWITDDGKEIEPGSIVVTQGHMYIYIGKFNSHGNIWAAQTIQFRTYLKSIGIDPAKVDRYTCSSWRELKGAASDHWRIESQSGTTSCPGGRFSGVVFSDGVKKASDIAYVYNIPKDYKLNFTFEINDDKLGIQIDGTSGSDTKCVYYLYETEADALNAIATGKYTSKSVAKVTMKTNGRQRLKLDPITASRANWAVEYRAPKGYKLSAKPIMIFRDSFLFDNTNHIYSSKLQGAVTVQAAAEECDVSGHSYQLSWVNENGETLYSDVKTTDSSGAVTFDGLDVYNYAVRTEDGKTIAAATDLITYTVSEVNADPLYAQTEPQSFTFENALLKAGEGNPYKVTDDVSEIVEFDIIPNEFDIEAGEPYLSDKPDAPEEDTALIEEAPGEEDDDELYDCELSQPQDIAFDKKLRRGQAMTLAEIRALIFTDSRVKAAVYDL